MTIPELLRSHFKSTAEPQAAFARRLGMTPQTVSQLLRGDIKVPTADVRRRLAKEFGLRHIDLLVMVGELTPDEIAPLPLSHIHDHRLREIVTEWPRLKPGVQTAIHGAFRSLMTEPGMRLEDAEAPVVAVAR